MLPFHFRVLPEFLFASQRVCAVLRGGRTPEPAATVANSPVSHASGGACCVDPSGASLTTGTRKTGTATVRTRLLRSNTGTAAMLLEPLAARANYLLGNDSSR